LVLINRESSLVITSAEIRTKLVDALQLDLVGPTPDDGEHAHEVLIQAPSKWYLCGFLAPFGAAIDLKSDETVDEELDQQAGNAASEDAAVPEAAAARKVPFPSSMGLSFLVSEQVTELKATVCWGDYLPIDLEEEETQEEEEERRKQIGWQRVPQKAELTVPLSVTSQPKHSDVLGGSGLTLVIANRPVRWSSTAPKGASHRFAEGTRSVSVFLVNYRASSVDRDRDTTFAFQTSLSLECTVGFIPRSDPRGGESIDWDGAVASVQYRDEYEFAVGHNVSVIAKSEGKSCTKICTNWIPTAEVAQVAPAYIPGIELSMEALASANDAVTLRQMVGPMVTAYESWITKQGKTPLQGRAEQVSQKLLQNADRARQRIAAGLTALDDPDVLDAFRLMNRVIATARRQQLSQEEGKPAAEFEPPSWRPFQLAFILLNLVSIAEPGSDSEVVIRFNALLSGGCSRG
jgi:hypothetical protein